jgi:hypothetical protein
MTIVSQKDVLFAKVQEFDVAQRTVDRVRSEMHCIIAVLPGEEQSKEAGVPSTSAENLYGVARSRNDECSEELLHYAQLDDSLGNKRSRPVVLGKHKPTVACPKLPPKPAKRMSRMEKKARIQEALLYHVANPHLTQAQAALHYGLEPKALSRPYAKKLKETLLSKREKSSKAVADDYLYNEKR